MTKTITWIATITFCVGLTSQANAQCAAGMLAKSGSFTTPAWQNGPAALEALRLQPLPAPELATPAATIVGLWNITFTSGGQVVDQGFDVWHSDGTELLNDTPAPATGNICVGIYARTATLAFKLYHPSWTFDDKGNLNGTAIIREQVTLDPNGDSFQGTFTVDTYDLAGNHLFNLAGTVSAKRIKVD